MDLFTKIIEEIIKEQEIIIGPIAIEQASKVNGLKIDWQNHQVSLEGDKTQILSNLVEQYRTLFGQASVEVCKEAINHYRDRILPDQLPQNLR